MWEQFVTLFTEMSPLAAIFLIVGIILIIVELFIPGFGICGTAGGILVIAGIIIRVTEGGSLAHLFMLLLLVVIIITAAFLIMVRSGRRGWLSRTSLFETGTVHADADGMTDGTPNYNFLFNVECKTVTSLRTSGKIIYENKYYDVVTQGDFIDANTLVRVVEVEGARIVVEKV